MNRTDTIFALASAPGRAGIAVIRLSGTLAGSVVSCLTGGGALTPRKAKLCLLRTIEGGPIDQALVLWFAAPHSFTGEDVAELHVHGGRAILNAIFDQLQALGLRPAEPGEFSRRAVEAGKFDLTQAEAIADLVDAETEAQRRQALRQYDGALGALYARWRSMLLSAQALAEAVIDFADEEIPSDVLDQARADASVVLAEMTEHLDDAKCGELVREGIKLAILGPPNAGKSSLVNALTKRDVAIVSPIPGTTRDVISVNLNIGGYAFVICDTAGLRESRDAVEAQGVARALNSAASADVIVLVRDGACQTDFVLPNDLAGKPILAVWNKVDLSWDRAHDGIAISAKTGEGMGDLIAALEKFAAERLYRPAVTLTRPRHRAALRDAVVALTRGGSAPDMELFAEDLRLASRAIGRIVGMVDVDEILDVVFREFCIGK